MSASDHTVGTPALVRKAGWEIRLVTFIEQNRTRPFNWRASGWNCVTCAAGVVEALTGSAVWAPDWKDEDEALRLLVKMRGLEAAATGVLGPPTNNWRHMRRGDIALVEQTGRMALMVCTGGNLVGPGLSGLEAKSLSSALKVWRVG